MQTLDVLSFFGFDLDFLTVHGDPHVVRAAKEGASGKDMKILAVTVLTSLDRADLDDGLIQPGDVRDIVIERATRAFEAGADGVIVEVHPNPDRALSDGYQSLNFEQFDRMMVDCRRMAEAVDARLG